MISYVRYSWMAPHTHPPIRICLIFNGFEIPPVNYLLHLTIMFAPVVWFMCRAPLKVKHYKFGGQTRKQSGKEVKCWDHLRLDLLRVVGFPFYSFYIIANGATNDSIHTSGRISYSNPQTLIFKHKKLASFTSYVNRAITQTLVANMERYFRLTDSRSTKQNQWK